MNSPSSFLLQDATSKIISLNRYSAECIENQTSYEESISNLSKVYNLIMASEPELDSSTSSVSTTMQQPEMAQQQQQQHLFDVDPLVKIPKISPTDPTGTQEIMMIYRHPIRIPSLLAECNPNGGGLLEGLVKVSVIFNLALSYHLLATSTTAATTSSSSNNNNNTEQQSDDGQQQQQQQQQQLHLLRKAYELYQLCLKIQPTCVHSKKAIFQLVVLNNMACICHYDLGDKTKRNIHLNDIVSIVIYMTSNPYNNKLLNHPSSSSSTSTIYESFFAPSVRLLMIGEDDDGIDEDHTSSSTTTTKNKTIYYSAVA